MDEKKSTFGLPKLGVPALGLKPSTLKAPTLQASPAQKKTDEIAGIHSYPRKILGIMQFGVTSTGQKLAHFKMDGLQPSIYGFELKDNPAAYRMYRPLLKLFIFNEKATTDSEMASAAQEAEAQASPSSLVGMLWQKKATSMNISKEVDFRPEPMPIGKIQPGPARAVPRTFSVKFYRLSEEFKTYDELIVKDSGRGKTSHDILFQNVKVGTFKGAFGDPGGIFDLPALPAAKRLFSQDTRYRIVMNGEDQNRSAYPDGRILVDSSSGEMMQVAIATLEQTMSKKPKLRIQFNGTSFADDVFVLEGKENAHPIMHKAKKLGILAEGEKPDEYVRVGTMKGQFDGQFVDIEIRGKEYKYVRPVGAMIYSTEMRQRQSPYEKKHQEELCCLKPDAAFPLKLEDLIEPKIQTQQRRHLHWEPFKLPSLKPKTFKMR